MREELGPLAVEPGEAKEREQRVSEGRRAERRPRLERHRHAERGERRREREPHALDRRADDADRLRRRSAPDERQRLFGDELEGAPGARALEPANRPVERRPSRRVREEGALQVGEVRRQELLCTRRQLHDCVARDRREVGNGSPQRGVHRAPRFVRDRDLHLGAGRQRLEQAPLGSGEILEPVREHRRVVPRPEVAGQELGGVTTGELTVPEAEPVQLCAVGAVEVGEMSFELRRVEQGRFEVGEGGSERVGESGVARGGAEPVEARRGHDAGEEERALRITQLRARCGAGVLPDVAEKVVERTDRSAEEGGPACEEVVLDPADVRPVRDNQKRVSVESFEIAIEETRHFPRVRGAHQESERHLLDSRRLPGGP